jgi:hypothetical protein
LSIQTINEYCRPYYDQAQNDSLLAAVGIYPLFDQNSPFWYRGYFLQPRATMNTVDSSLALFGCRTIIVGHTILKLNPAMYYKGKVIAIDVDEHDGHLAAVLYSDKKWWVVDGEGSRVPLEYEPTNDVINQKGVH